MRVAFIVSMIPTVIYVVIFSPSDQLGTSVYVYYWLYMNVLSCWILSLWWDEGLPLPLGYKIRLAGVEYVPPDA